MKSFARCTKLPSIGGRAAYMSDPGKQEEIVLESEPVDWKPYADYEATQHKTNARQNEGREMMVALSNDWYHLPKDELRNRVETIAKAVVGENRDYQWAVHWNKDRTNLHVHIIFSERQRVQEPQRWDRDIYLTADGKVARRKADRATNPDGSFKDPIHRKGELKSDPFTAKDANFKSKEWLHEKKQELRQLMSDRWGVKFERQPHLPEFHEGKGAEAETIKKKNIVIRENNRRLDFLESQGVNISGLVKELKAARRAAQTDEGRKDQTALLWQDSEGRYKVTVFHNPDRAIWKIDETKGKFMEQAAPDREAPELQQAEITAPEVPAPQDPKEIQPQATPERTEISDKKESHGKPTAPPERKQPEKAAPERKSFIERIRDTISSFIAQRAEKAAQKAAAEQAKKAAAEQAQKAAAEQAAAQRAAALAAQQQRMAAVSELKQIVESRWKTAEDCRFTGWKSIDGERALTAMRENDGAFPIVYRGDYGFSTEVFRADQVEQAKAFADRTEDTFNEWKERLGGRDKEPLSDAIARYREHQKEIAPAVEARLQKQRESRSQGIDR